jgi:hypothetical protein
MNPTAKVPTLDAVKSERCRFPRLRGEFDFFQTHLDAPRTVLTEPELATLLTHLLFRLSFRSHPFLSSRAEGRTGRRGRLGSNQKEQPNAKTKGKT